MCVYVCVRMRVCAYVWTRIYSLACLYIQTHICIYINIYICIYNAMLHFIFYIQHVNNCVWCPFIRKDGVNLLFPGHSVYICIYVHIYVEIIRNDSLIIHTKRVWSCVLSIHIKRRGESKKRGIIIFKAYAPPRVWHTHVCIQPYVCVYLHLLHVCLYIRRYRTYMRVCMNMNLLIHTHIYAHILIVICLCMYMYISVYILIYEHTYVYIYLRMHEFIKKCIYLYTYIYVNIYIHI